MDAARDTATETMHPAPVLSPEGIRESVRPRWVISCRIRPLCELDSAHALKPSSETGHFRNKQPCDDKYLSQACLFARRPLCASPTITYELGDSDQAADVSFEIEIIALSEIAQIDQNVAYELLCQYYAEIDAEQ